MATVNLDASVRTATGKGGARKARAAGGLPAVVYRSGTAATSINIDPAALELAFSKTGDRNTLVVLDLADGSKRSCLVKEVQRHPLSRHLEHVDFYEVKDDQTVTVQVRVKPVGQAVGFKLGGRLQTIRRSLSVRCLPANIPASVDIDISDMKVGDFVRVAQVPAPKNTELLFTSDFNVLTMLGKVVLVEEVDEEAETTNEPETAET